MTKMLTAAAAALCIAFVTGCTDLKPLQTQIDDLKSQAGKLSSQEATTKAAADTASRAA